MSSPLYQRNRALCNSAQHCWLSTSDKARGKVPHHAGQFCSAREIQTTFLGAMFGRQKAQYPYVVHKRIETRLFKNGVVYSNNMVVRLLCISDYKKGVHLNKEI